jgi:predicted TIM-barrel fold metal-dependent hydrolase
MTFYSVEKPPTFDVHQHLTVADEADFVQRRAELDRFGLTAALVMPSLQYSRPRGFADTRAVNDGIARYRDRYRERFPLALGTVQPTDPTEMSVGEVVRIARELKLDGVVWHHRFQGTMLADKRMHPLLDACAEHGLPAFLHVVADSALEAPWLLEELCEAHPDVRFVALDAFSGMSRMRYVVQMAKRCRNVIFDTAMPMLVGRAFEEFVHALGSERLIFGSNLYLPKSCVYPHVLREILDAPDLTAEDRRNILWNNAARLFPVLDRFAPA